MTLGALIQNLKKFPPAHTIVFDFAHANVGRLSSYRGDYSELAIGYGGYGQGKSVGELLAACEDALRPGVTFTGWKGGEYAMTKTTPVHVADEGNTSETEIVALVDLGWGVVIETTSGSGRAADDDTVAKSIEAGVDEMRRIVGRS